MSDLAAAAWSFIWSADFAGLLFGVLGTLLLATKSRVAGWGFVLFLASNAGWLVFAYEHGHSKLLAQHLVFAASSLLGVWVWLVQPRVKSAIQEITEHATSGVQGMDGGQ
jgi:nicotinamide riboside transporter PnuC